MRLLKIGRDASCNIVMHSDKVSSLHAELTILNNGDILLEDKGSTNGTFIMNQRIKPNKPVSVKRGDAIRFADTELQWSQVPMAEDNSAYQGIYGIGSHFNNDFQISGSTVSRYHATVKHGRDGKMYIVDHSKNGTMVDGVKIPQNMPYRIKKKSAVTCGGVPVDLSRLPWPNDSWKLFAGIAASIAVLVVVGIAIWNIIHIDHEWTNTEIYDRYNSSVVMIQGAYHYEVTAGSLDVNVLAEFGLPTRFVNSSDGLKAAGKDDYTFYTGTGFFVSEDGKMVTNLHVVKPWLFEKDDIKVLEDRYKVQLAKVAEIRGAALTYYGMTPEGLSAYISQIKIEGVSDEILFVPQGHYFKGDNAISCTVLSAGEDINKDVALIQSNKMELPNKKCSYVNVTDSLDISDKATKVGSKMFTIGFPHSLNIQNPENEKGIQVSCHSGNITSDSGEFDFQFDAVAASGASGSPVFNDHGKLIGIVNKNVPKENISLAVKGKYIKELLESPHIKK